MCEFQMEYSITSEYKKSYVHGTETTREENCDTDWTLQMQIFLHMKSFSRALSRRFILTTNS